jgi:hypothetical protein
MPDINPDAYERSDKELVYRRMELHHACIQIIVGQLQSLSEENIMIQVGGRNVPMRILLAAIIGDFPEQEKHAIAKGGCLYCKCDKEARDKISQRHEPINVVDLENDVAAACAEYMDEHGQIRNGCKTKSAKRERRSGPCSLQTRGGK